MHIQLVSGDGSQMNGNEDTSTVGRAAAAPAMNSGKYFKFV
jgi:hypothetical protein